MLQGDKYSEIRVSVCHNITTCTSSIKDLGVFFDSKLHLHNHVDFIFTECIIDQGWSRCWGRLRPSPAIYIHTYIHTECIKLLGLIRSSTVLHLRRPKLEYASVVQNSITSTDANKIECTQQKFTSVCFYRFPSCSL
jgi:hypothetical protein